MSVAEAMIQQARPHMLRKRAEAMIFQEVSKGCLPDISPVPAALEPPYSPLRSTADMTKASHDQLFIEETPPAAGELLRLRLWISPEQNLDWTRSELFLKQLSSLSHRVGFEIVGNEEAIHVTMLCHRTDVPVISTAFQGEFECCELTPDSAQLLNNIEHDKWRNFLINEYFCPPPYSHLLTRPQELKVTPYEPLFAAMKNIPSNVVAVYQCMFQSAHPSHNWHDNVSALLDYEFILRSLSAGHALQRYLQQSPSGDLRQMSMDVESKSHNDKPFFFIVLRLAVIGADKKRLDLLRSLSTFMSLFQHGGRPLNHITHSDYSEHLPSHDFRDMILRGLTYRAGSLANSQELVPLAHIFCVKGLDQKNVPLETMETLPARNAVLFNGTCIGEHDHAGTPQTICIPPDIRKLSTHIVSSPDMGKTVLMVNMALQDIEEGHGVAFIDAHRDAIKEILRLIPRRFYSKTIYLNPGDPYWIPLWNPIWLPPGGNRSRLVREFLSALKRVSEAWGDRLECVLRNALIGLGYLPNTTVLDLFNLTRQGSEESEQLRKRIISVAVDEPVRNFWKHDFCKDYKPTDLASPRHKLSKLVSGHSVSRMFSQPESKIDLEDVMTTEKILLVDLSDLGPELREILGAFILSLFLSATIRRTEIETEKRKPFSIFVDEAHLFVAADAIENIIAEARKFRIRLTVAHQFMSQFGPAKVDALSSVGATIIGRVDKRDAQYFTKDLQDMVDVKDIVRLPKYHMIAKIGSELPVKIKTLPLPEPAEENDGQKIIEQSHRLYCKPIHEVEREIARRDGRFYVQFGSLSSRDDGFDFQKEDFQYDEF